MTQTLTPSAASVVPEVAAPPLAPSGAPLCFVVDEEASIRHFLSLVLHGSGIDSVEFADGAAMREAADKREPDLIFHNISLESADATESVVALGRSGYRGAMQLMSSRGAAVLEHVKNVGIQHKLNMLPVLKKPFETEAIVKIIRELKLGMPPSVATRIDLDEALNNNWIEFWYQPKIALRKKQLAGAEAYVRARHPQLGILLPDAFLPGAQEASLIKLAERALASALRAGQSFAKLGINLRLAINVSVAALVKLPVEDIVRQVHPDPLQWPGLIIDVPEGEIVTELGLASELSARLAPCNVQLALDDFGRGHSYFAGADELPFAELKLARAFIAECGSDRVNAPLCKTAIGLAHNFGRAAVAMGVEKAADAVALVSMGCDYAQGFLLGQPMPEERFISLLRQRAATQGRALPAG